jgi:hypothetical protein
MHTNGIFPSCCKIPNSPLPLRILRRGFILLLTPQITMICTLVGCTPLDLMALQPQPTRPHKLRKYHIGLREVYQTGKYRTRTRFKDTSIVVIAYTTNSAILKAKKKHPTKSVITFWPLKF